MNRDAWFGMPCMRADVISIKGEIIQVGGHLGLVNLLFFGCWCGVMRERLLILWGVS
jgi:hypothetical protein